MTSAQVFAKNPAQSLRVGATLLLLFDATLSWVSLSLAAPSPSALPASPSCVETLGPLSIHVPFLVH